MDYAYNDLPIHLDYSSYFVPDRLEWTEVLLPNYATLVGTPYEGIFTKHNGDDDIIMINPPTNNQDVSITTFWYTM